MAQFLILSEKSSSFALSFGGLAQLARALAWQARGHRFESGILHSNSKASRVFNFWSFFHLHAICTQNWF